MRRIASTVSSLFLLGALMSQAACAQMQALAQESSMAAPAGGYHPNSIQPETTVMISADGVSHSQPDIAIVSAGVQADASTAGEAMAGQAKSMTGVFESLSAAGVGPKDMQTSNLSLYPRYDYIEVTNEDGSTQGVQRLIGYTASNELTIKIRDLSKLGEMLDKLVAAGGNTFNGVTFGLDDASEAQDEARRMAMKDATARAKLYADAAGLKVKRIVSITESGGYSPDPMPMARMMGMAKDEAYSTPIAAGEVGYSANVTVLFELTK